MKNHHSKYYVYIIAGVYLIYLAYQMARGLFAGEETGGAVIWLGIAAAVFAVCGILLILWSFRKQFLRKKDSGERSLSKPESDRHL